MPSEPVRPESWHLDKKVPISLIFVLITQLVIGAMWLSRIEGRIAETVSKNIEQQAAIDKLEVDTQSMAVSAERVATQLQAVRDSLTDLKESQRENNLLLRQIANGKGTVP